MKAFRKLGKTTIVKYGQKIGGMGEKNEGSNLPIFVRREIRESRGGEQRDEASEPDGHTSRSVPLPSCIVQPSQKEELCLLTLDTLSPLLLSSTWWKREPGQMMSARQHRWLHSLTSPITYLPPWVQSKSSGLI